MRVILRRRFLEIALGKVFLLGTGCGTIMYPERRGQRGGPLDWRVVAMDAAGLLLFFIPGVIAFAVDFTNGTIYLPPEGYTQSGPQEAEHQFVTVQIPDEQITVGRLEEIVSQHADREIQLTPGGYQTEELKTIDDFWVAADRHRGARKPG